MSRARIGDEDGPGELRVTLERELELDHLIDALRSRRAAEDDAAMRHLRMLARERLLIDEMHARLIISEIMREAYDGLAERFKIDAFFGHDIALALMSFGRAQVRAGPGSDGVQALFARDRILDARLHPGDAAERVRMTLAKPAAPKGIGLALGEDRLAKHPVTREEARIPTCRDDRELIASSGGRIHLLKILRDLRVRIKTIDGDEAPCELRPLLRKIGRRAATEEEDVNLVLLLI